MNGSIVKRSSVEKFYFNQNNRLSIKTMKKTFIQIIDDHKIWNLDLEDLIYAKSDRNYTHFYLVNGKTKTIVISLNKVMAEINN